MPRKKSKPSSEAKELNLTAMVDVVFQLLIFFVVTSDFQNTSIGTKIYLALAPHGIEVKKDPRSVYINVSARGGIDIAGTTLTLPQLQAMMNKIARERGKEIASIPIIIRGDKEAKHAAIKDVMDAVSGASDPVSKVNFKTIKFAALKERGK